MPGAAATNLTSAATNLTSAVVLEHPYYVHVSLYTDHLLRGTFVTFDSVMNRILRYCIEFHPQVGRHTAGLFVFPSTMIVFMTTEALSSSPFTLAVSMLTIADPSTPSGGSVGVSPLALILHIIATASSHRLGCQLWRLVPYHS